MESRVLMMMVVLIMMMIVVPHVQAQVAGPNFACGGHLSGESGFFGSPGFPQKYLADQDCEWRITVPKDRVVFLSFRFFDLESDPHCRYDHLSVFSGVGGGSEGDSPQLLGRFCGSFRPGALVSTSHELLARFHSDGSGQQGGFVAAYTAGQPHQAAEGYCGGLLEKEVGSFKTPNWPQSKYPVGITCSWHIKAPSTKVIELSFRKFSLERDTFCRYDYVSILHGDGGGTNSSATKFCGDTVPEPVTSPGRELFVHFVSDRSVPADGFMAEYRFLNVGGRKGDGGPQATKAPAHIPAATAAPTPEPCKVPCKRQGNLETNYCSSKFAMAAKVTSAGRRRGGSSLEFDISVLASFRAQGLAVEQAGRVATARLLVACSRCPKIKTGHSYILMGHVDAEGRAVVLPSSFVVNYKPTLRSALSNIKNRNPC
uniref:Procollagen C-endopeptidase enhancer 2-like n=1 Tax=Petromyzon marinus TaxID=7757 RepID=A0AAJ7UJZ2_PETMA|nr:procollagen C-endopeptidase enhancer 2-like [Petromyzon marinus]